MGGVKDVIDKVTGGLFGGGGSDDMARAQKEALRLQQETAAKAQQEAEKAASEKAAAEAAQRKKRANVSASGRASTLLAGENDGKTLLGK